MGFVASVCQPSILRMLIWPEASSAQNNIAAVSADGSTVCVLILRLNSSCSRSIALVVRALRHWLGGSRAKVNSRSQMDREATRRAVDELFTYARQYNSSKECAELLHFVARFRFYSPYNAMLIYTQMKGATYVAPAHRWMHDYDRRIKIGARPLVILQPMGPVMFVFDVTDTEPGPEAPAMPLEVEKPFEVCRGRISNELRLTI